MSKNRMTTLLTAGLSATLFLVSAVGCSMALSPAVGKWSGKISTSGSNGLAGMAAAFATVAIGDSPATLDLRGDGTGYMKFPTAPERPITWKADGDKIMVYGTALDSDKKKEPSAATEGVVGTLSSDKKTLTMDLGPIQVVMQKQDK